MGAPGYVTIAEARLARLLEMLIALSAESADDGAFIEVRDGDAFAEVEEAVNVFAAGFIEARRSAQAIERELRARVDAQESTISSLSVPVIDLWEDVVALPVVGEVDEARAQALQERLLERLDATGARHCIIDLTGVLAFEEGMARRLLEVVRAATVLGARCILSGLRGDLARELVRQDIALDGLATTTTLRQALRLCLASKRSGVEQGGTNGVSGARPPKGRRAAGEAQ